MEFDIEEIIASLKLLVYIAKTDGKLEQAEKKILSEAWQKVKEVPNVSEHLTFEQILNENINLEKILHQIVTPKIQNYVYDVAYKLAEIGEIDQEQEKILSQMAQKFQLFSNNSSLEESQYLEKLIMQSPDDFFEVIAEQLISTNKIRGLIFDYALGISILGFDFIPNTIEIRITIACILILKMIREIGHKWGYPKGQDLITIFTTVISILAALIISILTWVIIFLGGLYLLVLEEFATSVFLFTLTWTLGHITHQYYLNGRQSTTNALKQAFLKAQKEGKFMRKNF